jgi:hypothetical protein
MGAKFRHVTKWRSINISEEKKTQNHQSIHLASIYHICSHTFARDLFKKKVYHCVFNIPEMLSEFLSHEAGE